MKLLALFLLAFVALTGATRMGIEDRLFIGALSQAKGSTRAFEDELLAIMENIREIIINGDPDNGIPVLDPLEVGEFEIETEIPNTAEINLSVRDLNVQGLKDFVVDTLSFNILRLRLDYDFTIPSIRASIGYYDLLAKIINYNFFGEGSGDVEAVNLRLHGFATVTLQNGYLFMNNFEISVELEAFKSNLGGLLGGGEVSDVINEIVQVLVPALVESQSDVISDTIAEFVVAYANLYLTQMTLADLIDLITGGGGSAKLDPVPLLV